MNPHVPINSYQHFADLVSSVSSLLVLFLCFLDYFKPNHQLHVISPVTTWAVSLFDKDILKNSHHSVMKSNKINSCLHCLMLSPYSPFCDCLGNILLKSVDAGSSGGLHCIIMFPFYNRPPPLFFFLCHSCVEVGNLPCRMLNDFLQWLPL